MAALPPALLWKPLAAPLKPEEVAQTTRAGQIAIGTTGNTFTMAGITSAASRALQSGPISVVTSDAGGNLATTTNVASATSVAALDGRVTSLEASVAQLRTDVHRAYEGTAVAIALGGAAALPSDKRYALSGNLAPSAARPPSAACSSSG